MAREKYPLSVHLEVNAIYGAVGAVLGTIVWGLAFSEEPLWHGTVGGAVIVPSALYLTPIVVRFVFNEEGPDA